MPDAEVLLRLEKLAAEVEALHETMGVLIDDVAELKMATKLLIAPKYERRPLGRKISYPS